MTPLSPDVRPRSVDVAFWLLLGGAVLLLAAGLLSLTVSFSAVRQAAVAAVSDDVVREIVSFNRVIGVICALAALILGWLTGKLRRRRDARFRRAVMASALAISVVVAMLTLAGGAGIPKLTAVLLLIALLPTIAGAMLLARPAATAWFSAERKEPADG